MRARRACAVSAEGVAVGYSRAEWALGVWLRLPAARSSRLPDLVKPRATEPPGDWTAHEYDDGDWMLAVPCAYEGYWGGQPTDLYDTEATWIWWDTDCTGLGDGWFRLPLSAE
jgi:hypothetical protein